MDQQNLTTIHDLYASIYIVQLYDASTTNLFAPTYIIILNYSAHQEIF